LKILEWLLPLN